MLPHLDALPAPERMTPTQIASFVAEELVRGYGVTGTLPGADWLPFDIMHVWDYGPIGLPGEARRHPTLDIVRV